LLLLLMMMLVLPLHISLLQQRRAAPEESDEWLASAEGVWQAPRASGKAAFNRRPPPSRTPAQKISGAAARGGAAEAKPQSRADSFASLGAPSGSFASLGAHSKVFCKNTKKKWRVRAGGGKPIPLLAVNATLAREK